MTTATSAAPAAIDSREFRRVLGSFPTGVAVITGRDRQGGLMGLTCNSFSSVSLDPPLVQWSLRKASSSLAGFLAADAFAINVLAGDQDQLSRRFATSAIKDKFDGVAHSFGYAGLPLIEQCVARFECSVYARHEAGDHWLFIGRVEHFEQCREDDPLVFCNGTYMMLTESLREIAVQGRIRPADLAQARAQVYGLLVQLACENGQPEDFQAIRENLAEIDRCVAQQRMRERLAAAIRFFELISRAARSEVMAVVARSLNTLLLHTVSAKADARLDSIYVEALDPLRWEILACMERRDAAGAVRAIQDYVRLASLGAEAT